MTVRRGVYGTAPATHDAADLVEVGPRFPRPAIRDALLDELRSWPPKLYAVEAETVTFDLASRSAAFNGDVLHAAKRGRSAAIKQVLMDSHVVAGVGNIYANEAQDGVTHRRVA